jgi:hypothetical protein
MFRIALRSELLNLTYLFRVSGGTLAICNDFLMLFVIHSRQTSRDYFDYNMKSCFRILFTLSFISYPVVRLYLPILTVRFLKITNLTHNSFFFVYIYSNSLHASSITVLIIRRINCIHTTSGICPFM